MAAIGNATKHGFLVREGDALERLSSVKKIAFDKTGTLTFGKLEVIAVKSIKEDISETEIFRYAAAAEKLSEHPIGKAVTECYVREVEKSKALSEVLPEAGDFHMKPGKGIAAEVEGKEILAGNISLLKEAGVSVSKMADQQSAQYLKKGATVVYLAVDSCLCGFLALADTLRPESAGMIERLKAIGVSSLLLTGDHENAAKTIASGLHIDEIKANCLPEDKLSAIEENQKAGKSVCMIGDGINDAPALKKADVGIAMGGVGSDIAVDAADIALVDDKIEELPHLLALSKRMMTTIRWNLTFSMTLNFIAIALAITGILNPVVGALVHNAGSVLVIINSALLLKWKN